MRGLTRYPKGLGRQRDNIAGMLLDMLQDKLPNLSTFMAYIDHKDSLLLNIVNIFCPYYQRKEWRLSTYPTPRVTMT